MLEGVLGHIAQSAFRTLSRVQLVECGRSARVALIDGVISTVRKPMQRRWSAQLALCRVTRNEASERRTIPVRAGVLKTKLLVEKLARESLP